MPKYPFLILSDIHMNDWSSFSYIRPDKINSRLWETMEAVREAVQVLKAAGGKDIVITGDLFHTRGKIKPSVYNPVFDLFVEICKDFNVWCLPGNHDLEGKDSDTIGNAIHPFSQIQNFRIFDEVTEMGNFVFIPWIEQKDDFVGIINGIQNPLEKVVFCHIGIDGVLDGVSGKVGTTLFNRGFKYVFSGDYHNFKALGNGLHSVGALTHHNFGDTNSTAGFLIVTQEKVVQQSTKAPRFVGGGSKRECSGNIVRLTGLMTEEEAADTIKAHYDYGAKFVQDLTSRPTIKAETLGEAVRVDLSLDAAVESYVKRTYGEFAGDVQAEIERQNNEHV